MGGGGKKVKIGFISGEEKADNFWSGHGVQPEKLQRMAIEIWSRNPSLSKLETAKIIGEKTGIPFNTIRKKISK